RLFELIVANQPVPELMAELVDGYALGAQSVLGRPEIRAYRDERGIFHAAGSGMSRHVYDGHGVIRILAVPKPEILHGVEDGAKVAVGDVAVSGLEQKDHVDIAQSKLVRSNVQDLRPLLQFVGGYFQAPIEGSLIHQEARAGGPGKVVHVFLILIVGDGAVGVMAAAAAVSGRADNVIGRHGEV